MKRAFIVTTLAAALVTVGSPVMAMTPKPVIEPGWSPSYPPFDVSALATSMAMYTYATSCGDARATGWSAQMKDDTAAGVASLLITASTVTVACEYTPGAVIVRQGEERFTAQGSIRD